jgi:hypothetical protein
MHTHTHAHTHAYVIFVCVFQVHHKTEFGSNLTGHGYPDPGHLDSMVDQLRALGVGPDDLL